MLRGNEKARNVTTGILELVRACEGLLGEQGGVLQADENEDLTSNKDEKHKDEYSNW